MLPVIGQKKVLKYLQSILESGKIPHALMFSGDSGTGTLPAALYFAGELICREHPRREICNRQCAKLQHPDLHFAFPTAINSKVKKHPVSELFLDDWRNFVTENSYGNLFDWYRYIQVENKQGQMGVEESKSIVGQLRYRPYEGTRQVMILWMVETLNAPAANKLLKIIEEPPANTVFILITENEEQIIDTIRSRCQILRFDRHSEEEIIEALVEHKALDEGEARIWAARADGSFGRALSLMKNAETLEKFDRWFVTWVRAAFRAKGNASVIRDLVEWSNNIASEGKEVQKEFLKYTIELFRQALLTNYSAGDLVSYRSYTDGFDLKKFAPFVHNGNITRIIDKLEDSTYHIRRNANAKLLFLDLSIQLTRLLHTPPEK